MTHIKNYNDCIELLRGFYPPETFPGIAEQCLMQIKCKMTELLSVYLEDVKAEEEAMEYLEVCTDSFHDKFYRGVLAGILDLEVEIPLNDAAKCCLKSSGELIIRRI